MQITILTRDEVMSNLKARVLQASKDFVKNPNATQWIVQTRAAFVYQQAYYYLHSGSHTVTDKMQLLHDISTEPNGNWGDVICQHALGMTLQAALREHANCP